MIGLVLPYSALFLVGLFGSYVTKQVQGGLLPIWSPIFPSILSGLVWGYISRRVQSLSLASVVVDVVYAVSYVSGFLLLGETLTMRQVAGFLVALAGVVMMSL